MTAVARLECVAGIGRIGGESAKSSLITLAKSKDEALATVAKDVLVLYTGMAINGFLAERSLL